MIAAIVVRHDLDWRGFLIVVGLVGGLSALAYLDAMRAARKAARHQQLVDDAEQVATDHEQCRHDGCDRVLDYCRTATRCPGTVEPGCGHVSLFCEDHAAGGCEECRVEARREFLDAVEADR